jgi:hypothetical protein
LHARLRKHSHSLWLLCLLWLGQQPGETRKESAATPWPRNRGMQTGSEDKYYRIHNTNKFVKRPEVAAMTDNTTSTPQVPASPGRRFQCRFRRTLRPISLTFVAPDQSISVASNMLRPISLCVCCPSATPSKQSGRWQSTWTGPWCHIGCLALCIGHLAADAAAEVSRSRRCACCGVGRVQPV